MLRAFRVGPLVVAFCITGVLSWALATVTLPTFRPGIAMHLWTLVPGALSALAVTGSSSQLSELDWVAGRRAVTSRLVVAATVMCAALGAVLPAALSIHRPDMFTSSEVLIAVGFGASAIVGNAAWLVGAADIAVAMLEPGAFADSDPSAYVVSRWPMLSVAAVLGCLVAYCVRGARGRRRFG